MTDVVHVTYTGAYPVSIISDNIGMVNPGDTFPVPSDRADSYTSRSDMILTVPDPPAEGNAEPSEPTA